MCVLFIAITTRFMDEIIDPTLETDDEGEKKELEDEESDEVVA